MSSIAEERKQIMQEGPSASLLSSKASSSFCSFDAKIWEELHLQSLSSAMSSSLNEDDTEIKGQLWKSEKTRESKSSSHSFSFFSSTFSAHTSFSGLSSPHRLSTASSTSGYPLLLSRRENTLFSPMSYSPLHYKAEEPPVVKVIQTGTMSFTSDELVLQQATINREELSLIDSSSHVAESMIPPLEEESPSMTHHNSSVSEALDSNDKSIVLSSFPSVKLMQVSASDVYTTPISPFKSKGSIPFKWEEAPGRPKLHADPAQAKLNIPSLQLPPKLLQSSYSLSNCNSPYLGRSHSKHTASPSRSSADGCASKPTLVKSLWHSFVQSGRKSYREGGSGRSRFNMLMSDEDPWSPTSTLIGPDASLSSTSSISSVTLDAMCASPGRIPEVQSAPTSRGSRGAFHMDDKALPCSQSSALLLPSSSSSSSLCNGPSFPGNQLTNLAPSMERREELPLSRKATDRLRGFWGSCRRWRSLGAHRKRNHEEAEMWEPTLATYFHSMELERTSSTSGQSLLEHQRSSEKHKSVCHMVNPIEVSTSSVAAGASMDNHMISMNGSKCLMREDVMVFSANSTNGAREKPTLGLKSKNGKFRRKGGWVLRKLRKSSRVLAAMLRAVAKGRTSRVSSKKCKRRRLPYQHITW